MNIKTRSVITSDMLYNTRLSQLYVLLLSNIGITSFKTENFIFFFSDVVK